ncbi:NADPH dehydrogenase NamA [Rurimicrobium arvi]|uniref:NADH:flavin oxidoreductase/NADH oxidase n=1 Tax=Rurimicrobium arvi TaxID=2049916 RepID=A0ABP8MLR3_9BACT
MSELFSPLTIKSVTLRNRIVMSPMCQYSAEDGFANDWHLVHLGSRAVGGSGLIIMEATAVVPEGRISYADMGIWKDEHIAPLKKITDFIHAQGSVAGIQLAHAGRKASAEKAWNGGRQIAEGPNSWTTVAPSAVPYHEKDRTPHELSVAEIKEIISAFRDAARRALDAGFKVVEIHAAHGYLIHQFYSALSNFRTDEYGGSFDNRIRFLLEIIDAVQTVWPADLPLFVRISATEWVEDAGAWTIEDSVRLAAILKDKGVDLIDASSAANIPKAPIPVGPGYQVPLAAAIRKGSGVMTGAVGMITEPEQAEAILKSGAADLIFLGRELLRNPYFPVQAAQTLGAAWKWPDQYERAK